jgi:hypothetical protein
MTEVFLQINLRHRSSNESFFIKSGQNRRQVGYTKNDGWLAVLTTVIA